jgi:hypothetical protein
LAERSFEEDEGIVGAIWHLIINGAISFAVTAATFVAVNLVFALSGVGNPAAIRSASIIRKALHGMRPGTVLECHDRRVSALVYDRLSDTESSVPLFRTRRLSLLAWPAGNRTPRSLYGRANAELAITVAALLLVYLPLLAAGVYLAVNVSWLWWLALVVLIGAEAVMTATNKLFYLKWRAFGPVALAVFLHQYHLYPLTATCVITFCLVIVSMVATVWIEHSL